MSERTSQDVLRELRRAVEALAIGHPGDTDDLAYDKALRHVLDEIDKAIAEALDSPPNREREAYDAGRLAGFEEGLAVPDTLSEKPGLDDAAELAIKQLEACPCREHELPLAVLRAALSEKPGLPDLDWLMGHVVARFSDPEYHRAKDIILRIAGFPTARALKETACLASTDSEGR